MLKNRIQDAIDNDKFSVYYQPQYDARNKTIIGLEALVWWENNGVFMPPLEFIAIAESTSLMIPLVNIIISKVFEDMPTWLNKGIILLFVSINLSTKQLQDEKLTFFMERLCKSFDIKPYYISFEISEDAIIVQSIIALAKNMNLAVIAEGVESSAQKDFLLEKGVF